MKCLIILSAVSLAIGVSFPAHAHSWYPQECCSGQDCAPVENLVRIVLKVGELPQLIVRSKQGKAVIPPSLPLRDSQDGRMHVCMRHDAFGDLEVVCVFVPPYL